MAPAWQVSFTLVVEADDECDAIDAARDRISDPRFRASSVVPVTGQDPDIDPPRGGK